MWHEYTGGVRGGVCDVNLRSVKHGTVAMWACAVCCKKKRNNNKKSWWQGCMSLLRWQCDAGVRRAKGRDVVIYLGCSNSVWMR